MAVGNGGRAHHDEYWPHWTKSLRDGMEFKQRDHWEITFEHPCNKRSYRKPKGPAYSCEFDAVPVETDNQTHKSTPRSRVTRTDCDTDTDSE
jgi:hypothetical protein